VDNLDFSSDSKKIAFNGYEDGTPYNIHYL